jgi:hypothetical protein
MHAEQEADAGWSPPADHPELDDPPLPAAGCAARAAVRAAGSVDHACSAMLAVAIGPSAGGGVRRLEALGRAAQGPALLDDAARQQ